MNLLRIQNTESAFAYQRKFELAKKGYLIIMTNCNRKDERLQDLNSNGKPRPWKEKKRQNLNLVASYGRLKVGDIDVVDEVTHAAAVWQEKYAKYEPEVKNCASYLEFYPDGRLAKMYTCQRRLCAMCNWRKSIKVFTSVSKVMDVIEGDNPDIQPVFLTLTQQNCAFDDLDAEIKRIFEGFRRLTNNRVVKEQVVGWFRALEITYSKNTDTWHPHIHVILLFNKDYFSKKNKRYINQVEWVRLWQLSMRLDYAPNVDVRAVRPGKDGSKRKAIAEVAKYPLKDKTVFSKDLDLTDRLVDCLTRALFRKRLYAFGGLMAKVAKQLKLDKPDEGDLIKVGDDEAMREDVANALIAYRWDFGLLDYVRMR